MDAEVTSRLAGSEDFAIDQVHKQILELIAARDVGGNDLFHNTFLAIIQRSAGGVGEQLFRDAVAE